MPRSRPPPHELIVVSSACRAASPSFRSAVSILLFPFVYSCGETDVTTGQEKVLIIEDDRDIAEVVAMNLRDLGLHAERAEDAHRRRAA